MDRYGAEKEDTNIDTAESVNSWIPVPFEWNAAKKDWWNLERRQQDRLNKRYEIVPPTLATNQQKTTPVRILIGSLIGRILKMRQ
jgi:hypothetical protein